MILSLYDSNLYTWNCQQNQQITVSLPVLVRFHDSYHIQFGHHTSRRKVITGLKLHQKPLESNNVKILSKSWTE